MLIDSLEAAPLLDSAAPTGARDLDGMIHKIVDGATREVPGDILALWLELRKGFGALAARKKEGVKFKVRSAEELIDKLREDANEKGILIYPAAEGSYGKAHPVEDGTLAEVQLTIVLQAVSDGSRLAIGGFGLGADNQDKAGGKAGTYAFKQALVQALLAGGKENAKALGVQDTDDSSEPIIGGVKQVKPGKPSLGQVQKMFAEANTDDEYQAAFKLVRQLGPDKQVACKDLIVAAKARVAANAAPVEGEK